jgi:hypothetical protein
VLPSVRRTVPDPDVPLLSRVTITIPFRPSEQVAGMDIVGDVSKAS